MPSLFSTPKTPELPPVKPVAEMPDPLAQDASKKKKTAMQVAAAGGRSSTFLDAGNSDKLGG